MSKRNQFYLLLFCTYLYSLGLFACNSYYKVTKPAIPDTEAKSATITQMDATNRYFILRNGLKAYAMTAMHVSSDKKTIQANLTTIPDDHLYHVLHSSGADSAKKRTPAVKSKTAFNEVHIYIAPDSTVNYGAYNLNVDQVKKIEIIEYDQRRTNNSSMGTGLLITTSAILLVGIIALATKSSCPFVSAHDGNAFTLQGEIYGGAIYPQLARHDYLPLKMAPMPDGYLQLKISNELKERQYTDLAELWVVSHPVGTEVYADESGALQQVTKRIKPVTASLNSQKNVLEQLVKAGDELTVLMDDTSNSMGLNELVVRFKNPGNIKKANLILNAKNSYFLDALYGKVAQGLGTYYTQYISEQKTKTAEELKRWITEQNIPLDISIKTSNEWAPITKLNTIGPLANRTMVVPINIPAGAGEEIEIKLSCGFQFWEIDELSLSVEENKNITVEKLLPAKAIDHFGNDVKGLLSSTDKIFLHQPNIGDVTTISFHPSGKLKKGYIQSYILHANGHYEHVREFTNPPDIKFLNGFKKPGAMSQYGMAFSRQSLADQINSLVQKQ